MTKTADLLQADNQLLRNMTFRNYIANGGFDLWSHGTSQSASGMDSADLWDINMSPSGVAEFERIAFTPSQQNVPGNPTYHARMTITTSGVIGTAKCSMVQSISPGHLLNGQVGVISFRAKADAAKPIMFSMDRIWDVAEITDNIGTETFNLTTNWQRYYYTFPIPTTDGEPLESDIPAGSLRAHFIFEHGDQFPHIGIGLQTGVFDIADIQFEQGSIYSEFERRPAIIEQLLCGLIT
jgi:hypothetical protein